LTTIKILNSVQGQRVEQAAVEEPSVATSTSAEKEALESTHTDPIPSTEATNEAEVDERINVDDDVEIGYDDSNNITGGVLQENKNGEELAIAK